MQDKTELKSLFIEFLEKLNNGEQISLEDVEKNYME